MKQFKITFKTLDGNINIVYIDAYTQLKATFVFERDYQYDEILTVEEI